LLGGMKMIKTYTKDTLTREVLEQGVVFVKEGVPNAPIRD